MTFSRVFVAATVDNVTAIAAFSDADAKLVNFVVFGQWHRREQRPMISPHIRKRSVILSVCVSVCLRPPDP